MDELERCFLFQDAPLAAREAADLPAEPFSRGEILYDATHFRPALGLVLHGRAEAVSATQEKAVLAVFRPGSVFGAAALFGGGERYVSCIRAVTDCTVLFFPEDTLRRWFSREAPMAMSYIAFLSDRVRFLNGKIAIFTQSSVEQRLYRWLLANCDAEGHLPARLSMAKLAGTLSIGRTSLYRALDALEKDHLIVRRDKNWEVIR